MNNRLRELRLEAKLSSQELAEIINTTKSNISMYENGKRQFLVPVLKKFCDFFSVTRDYLLGETDRGIYLTTTNGFTTISKKEWNEYITSGHAALIKTDTQIIRQASEELSHSILIKHYEDRKNNVMGLDVGTCSIGYRIVDGENSKISNIIKNLQKLNEEQLTMVESIIKTFIESNSTKKE